jgi:hypothetical protein
MRTLPLGNNVIVCAHRAVVIGATMLQLAAWLALAEKIVASMKSGVR